MPVDSKHPSYEHHYSEWRKCRDCVCGEEAVKAGKYDYLPQLDGQESSQYEAYLRRALFYSASQRTVRGLSGAVMRKDPVVSHFPDEELLDNLGPDGESVSLLIKQTVDEQLTTGRLGVFVDSNAGENDPSAPPYVTIYFPENIINWGERIIQGRKTLTLVVLLEDTPELDTDGKDPFVYNENCKYRVLKLEDADTANPRYVQEVWQKREISEDEKEEKDEDGWDLVSSIEPKFWGGRSIPYIPFVFLGPDGVGKAVQRSPILDLVNVNLSHYRNSADHEHGLHFTALPTAWVAGFDPASTRLRIGSSSAWVTENTQARCGFLEFSGSGLGAIKEAMQEKKQMMAVLGARLLEEQKAESESGAAIRLRHAGEDSILSNMVKSVDEAYTFVLQWVAEWIGRADATITVECNDEFNPLGIDPQTLNALMMSVQSGLLSWDTFFYNAKRGNLVPDDTTPEDEKAKIEMGFPTLPAPDVTEEQAVGKGGGQQKSSGKGGTDLADAEL